MNRIASVLTGMSSPKAKLCLPILMTLVLAAVVLFTGACSSDSTEPTFPPQPIPEPQDWLFTIYGNSGSDIYAGGARGALFHYDGNDQNRWTKISSGTSTAITDIWGAGSGVLYATGHNGVILTNSGGDWNNWTAMSSGTTQNLYGIGRFNGDIYACGDLGVLLRLNGSSWGGTGNLSWILDDSGAPSDTLLINEDYASLVTVSSFFIGGAYNDPNYVGQPEGMDGTKGGVIGLPNLSEFTPDPVTGAYSVLPNWILRPISGEQIVSSEWMLCTTSDPDSLSRNYLGTSEGWLFQLSDARGDTVWTKFFPSVTQNPGAGIQDIWLDPAYNLYMVTDEGKIVYQTHDYKFNEDGERVELADFPVTLTGIWGVDPTTFYVVGYIDETIYRCSHDPVSGYFNYVAVAVDFDAAKATDSPPTVDKFGRPLF